MERPPEYKQPPVDPQMTALQQQADHDRIAAVSDTARMDTASLMARYGTRLALGQSAGASGGAASATMASPMTAPPNNVVSLVSLLFGKAG